MSRWRAALVALIPYCLLSVASLAPQSLHPLDTVAYAGDSLESVYIVAWNVHQFFHAPTALFDANVLYPHPRALAFTDHRLLPSLLVAPVVWATGNPVLAYNVALGLALLLAAFAARHLALVLGTTPLGAWACGALYAFHTYQINEAPRLNIVFHGFIPLALAQLVLLLRGGQRRHAWGVAVWMLLQGLSSNYHLLYGSLVLALVAGGSLVLRPALWRRLLALALPGAVAALAFSPIALVYLRSSSAHGFVRELPPGIDLQHYVSTSPSNLLYGPIGTPVRLQQRGPHFVGFVSLGLMALALLAWLRRRDAESPALAVSWRILVPAAAALALLLVALSLGRDLVAFGIPLGPGPYRLLYHYVPGFQLVRIPERLSLLAMLFVALLVARGLDLLQARGLRVVACLLAALVPLEHLSPLALTTRVPVGRDLPAVYGWLREHPVQALAEVPVRGEGLVREETLEMYFSTAHFKPIVHGYTAYPPLLSRLIRRFAAQFPAEASLQAFGRLGVDTVVVHQGRTLAAELLRRLPGEQDADAVLRAADLDLYAQLPAAVAAGRVRRIARFDGAAAHLFDSSADEVYQLVPGPELPAARFPHGRRLVDPGWRYRTKEGDPQPATDNDPATAWVVPHALRGDEFFEITFARGVPVAGVVLPLRRDSAFPTRFRIGGRDAGGRWAEVARFDTAQALQLLDRLRGGEVPAIGFDLGGRELFGISLLVETGGTSFDGWSLPEVEVWVPS
jgi:hypothetical protein